MNRSSEDTKDLPWAWVGIRMPLLRRTAEESADSLSGLTVGWCLHLEPKTAVLIDVLLESGGDLILEVTRTGAQGFMNATNLMVPGLPGHGRRVRAVRQGGRQQVVNPRRQAPGRRARPLPCVGGADGRSHRQRPGVGARWCEGGVPGLGHSGRRPVFGIPLARRRVSPRGVGHFPLDLDLMALPGQATDSQMHRRGRA